MCGDLNAACLELVKGLPTAFIALVVGLIAAYIGWRQHITANAKVKLDLFDKRYEIFDEAWTTLSRLYELGPTADIRTLSNYIPRAEFLYGDEIASYLRTVVDKARELRALHRKMGAEGYQRTADDEYAIHKLDDWVMAQLNGEVRRTFAPWLSFHNWNKIAND